MARTARVETERANALDAKVETTLSSMAERAERAAAAAERAEKAVDRALERFFAGRAASESSTGALPAAPRPTAAALPAPPASASSSSSSFRSLDVDAGESPPTPAARREWKPAKLPPPPPPLPAEVDGTAGATAHPRFDEARARRLIEMMEESPEMENPTFVASIRAVIDALVR